MAFFDTYLTFKKIVYLKGRNHSWFISVKTLNCQVVLNFIHDVLRDPGSRKQNSVLRI